MSITDELRKWMGRTTIRFDDSRYLLGTDEELTAIADRIDAEHERQLEVLYRDMSDAEWMRLPKDADGVPIHIGDVMDGTCPSGKHVNGTVNAIGDGVFWLSNVQFSLKPDYMHHYHAPTVEDVLREMADRCYADEDEPRDRDAIVAEFAAKLRLAGGDDE